MNKIIQGDCLEGLKTLPDESVNCCVTSPPYFGLRDYGHEGQIGLEETPEAFVVKMVDVFTEVKRVLKKDGTLWLNLGDSYARNPQTEKDPVKNSGFHTKNGSAITAATARNQRLIPTGLKPKDMIGIPWMVAFALRSYGWYLRCDIIWHKRNPMPESVKDRPTKAHEYIFLLSKSEKYYYDADAIAELSLYADITGMDKTGFKDPKKFNGKHSDKQRGHSRRHAGFNERWDNMTKEEQCSGKRNKRSVWDVPTKPFSEAHFATFPEDLIVDCIKAGCPEGGVVLDPFMGAGTTALVAAKLGRNYIGFELNTSYIEIAEKRLQNELGMFHPCNVAP